MKKIISLLLITAIFLGLGSISVTASSENGLKAGTVNTQYTNLNVRTGPSVNSSIKTSLSKNSYLTVLREDNSFYYVRYGENSYGYCHSRYIKILSDISATVNVSYGNLNVREGASLSYKIKDKLTKDESVVILSEGSSWSYILYNGNNTGYVYNSYLKKNEPVNKATVLSVPSFKQTDSRWANVTLGSSGKTIGKIGCATTAIAMMESFRNGYIIYPDTMSKKLRYSSSGDVYWPSDYKVTLSNSNMLESFLRHLEDGKPVMLGAKNRYGSQHWIVVTGFKGGELKAENFTINDPGSSSRTNLSQFLSSYPVFYKYFTY